MQINDTAALFERKNRHTNGLYYPNLAIEILRKYPNGELPDEFLANNTNYTVSLPQINKNKLTFKFDFVTQESGED